MELSGPVRRGHGAAGGPCAISADDPDLGLVYDDDEDDEEIAGVRLDAGKHTVGIFVIPQNRIFSVDRDLVVGRPHQVQLSY